MREVTRDEFLATRPARKHDEEIHDGNGATCMWRDGQRVTHEEYQPDFGPCRWFVAD